MTTRYKIVHDHGDDVPREWDEVVVHGGEYDGMRAVVATVKGAEIKLWPEEPDKWADPAAGCDGSKIWIVPSKRKGVWLELRERGPS